ncbi:MAG: radical SAM protein [Opitutaceae bacterium]|nr:radical SAM protein [Opitutaceae bacterium]
MKVLFTNPPWWEADPAGKCLRGGVRAGSRWPFTQPVRSTPDHPVWGEYVPYPFFMGYAAAYVARHTGAQVRLRDSIALRESYQAYFNYLLEEKPDVVFLESATPSWDHDAKVIASIARHLPHARIAVCGPIATFKAGEILATLPVVACIQGEYEKGAVKVVNGATGVLEHDLLTVGEMNEAPFPYYDEWIARRYFDYNPHGQLFPHAHVWSSRGCPFKCIFCVWPATMTGHDPDGTHRRTVRHYTPEYMLAFLQDLQARFHFASIYFDDDTFNLGNSHVVKMCEVMRRIKLPWSAMCRADTVKPETWKLMRDSGCFGVKLGFESGSQHVVDQIVNKGLDLEEARRTVFELKRLGLTVHGTFTYGLPGETKEQMQDTKRFIASLPFDSVQESGAAEIEGTPLHTLRTTGRLDAYAGAQMDQAYVRAGDGMKKFQHVIHELVNG